MSVGYKFGEKYLQTSSVCWKLFFFHKENWSIYVKGSQLYSWRGQKKIKIICSRAKWTTLSELFLYISMYSRGDQRAKLKWLVSWIWPMGSLLRTPNICTVSKKKSTLWAFDNGYWKDSVIVEKMWCGQAKSVGSRKYWFKIQPNKAEDVICFLLFLASFNCSYLWNQLTNFNEVFCKI